MSTTTSSGNKAEEIALSIHLLAGRFLDEGITMEETLEVMHRAVELVPMLEAESKLCEESVK